MARRRSQQQQQTQTVPAAVPIADDGMQYSSTPRTVAGFGRLFLSKDSTYAIDPLSWRENPWAMAAVIAQAMKVMVRRPIRSSITLVIFGVTTSFVLAFARSSILVAAGRATPVTARDVTDPTSGTQVASWLGSQVGAPLTRSGTGLLVRMSEDSLGGAQDAIPVSNEGSQSDPWAAQNATTQVSNPGTGGGKIRLIQSQGRR
jgi:hypothetical protein